VKRQIVINSSPAETRVAILEDGRLMDFYVERAERDRLLGHVMNGRVVKLAPSMQAAFVDAGLEADGFLPFADCCTPQRWRDGVRARCGLAAGQALKVGHVVPVQVVKEPIGTKGARLSMELSLAGRYLVLIPGDEITGVSRRIKSTGERRRLKALLKEIRPEGHGLIVRTVAEGHSEEQLLQDLRDLLSHWEEVARKLETGAVGEVAHREPGMVSHVMRDLFTADLDEVVCDNRGLHKELTAYMAEVLPELRGRVRLYTGKEPLFDSMGVEEEIERSIEKRVWLKGGGYLFIEATEAMITIDVNSGRFARRRNLEDNALRVNQEAAKEIGRQLRLRDLGGLIVIDFIDMQQEEHRLRLLQEMRQLLKQDRAQTDVAPLSRFGLMEMTRERVRPALIHTLHRPCRHCAGTGLVPSRETLLTELDRWIRRFKAATGERRLLIQVAPELHAHLTAGRRNLLWRMMWRHFMLIRLKADERLEETEFRCLSPRQGRDVTGEHARGVGAQRMTGGTESVPDYDGRQWDDAADGEPDDLPGLSGRLGVDLDLDEES
jgi:ribonuclease G